MEVRALLVDGTCDDKLDDMKKKACIKVKLVRLYPPPHRNCASGDLDAAVEHCYFSGANIPFPIPIPVPDVEA